MSLLAPFLITVLVAPAQPAAQSCGIDVTQTGETLTISGLVDTQRWVEGTYRMRIDLQRGSNRSVSSQSGGFQVSAGEGQKNLVVATSTLYVGGGAQVDVVFDLRDGTRHETCTVTVGR